MADLSIVLSLAAEDGISDVLGNVKDALSGLEGAAGLAGDALLAFGAAATAVGTALGVAVDQAAGFQQMMVDIQNNTGMSSQVIADMGQQVMQLAQTYGVSTNQIADGYKQIINITRDSADAQGIMNVALESAASTGANTANVAQVLAMAMHAYGLDTSNAADAQQRFADIQANAAHVMGVMHIAAQDANVDLGTFADNTGRAMSIAATMGLPIEQVDAAFAALSKHLPDAAQAGTQLTDLLIKMSNPTKQQVAALTELSKKTGVDLVSDFSSAGLHAKGLTGVLADLKDAYQRMGYSESDAVTASEKLINAQRGGLGLNILLNQGYADYQRVLADVSDQEQVNQVTEESWNRSRETAVTQWNIFKQTIGNVAIILGTALLPAVTSALQGLNGMAQGIEQFVSSDGFQQWAAGVVATIGNVAQGIGSLAGMFGQAFGSILSVVSTAGQSIYTALQWINPFARHSPSLVEQVQDGVSAIQDSYATLGQASAPLDAVKARMQDLTQASADFQASFGDGLKASLQKALEAAGPDMVSTFQNAKSAIDDAKASVNDLKSQWEQAKTALEPFKQAIDDAKASLEPFKTALDDAKGSLQDQQDTLRDLQNQLADAQAAYDPLKQQLADLKKAATDANTEIRNLTSTPLQGSAEMADKIAKADAAVKQQTYSLAQVKASDAYLSLASQITTANEALQKLQNTPAGTGKGASAAHTAAVDEARQRLDDLKNQQQALLQPLQEELTKRQAALDLLNAQKAATISVQQEQIKAAADAATRGPEQSEQSILAQINAAKQARDDALAKSAQIQPQADAALAIVDQIKAKVQEQQEVVRTSQQTVNAATKAYNDHKKSVDDATQAYNDQKRSVDALGQSYQNAQQQLSQYSQQLSSLQQQVQTAYQNQQAAEKAGKSILPTPSGNQNAPDLSAVTSQIDSFNGAVQTAQTDAAAVVAPVQQASTAIASFGPSIALSIPGLSQLVLAFQNARTQLDAGWWKTALGTILDGFGDFRDQLVPAVAQWAAVLADWALKAVPGLMDNLQSLVQQVWSWISDRAPEYADRLGQWAAAFIQWVIPTSDRLLSTLEDVTMRVLDWIQEGVPAITGALFQWASAFLDWVLPMVPPLLGQLASLAGELIVFLAEDVLPKIVTILGEWGKAFIDWVGPQIPGLLAALGDLAAQLLDWTWNTALPQIADHLIKWGTAFIEWVAPQIPPLLAELAKLLAQLGEWIVTTALPAIAQKLLEWGKAFVAWVAPQIPPLLAEAGKLLAQLGSWITDTAAPQIAYQLGVWAGDFVQWVEQVLPQLPGELQKIADSIISWLQSLFDPQSDVNQAAGQLGASMVQSIIDGITNAIPNFISSVGKNLGDAWSKITSSFGVGFHTGSSGAAPSGPYVDYARQAAQAAGIDPNIFVRQIQQESGFDPSRVSPAGAIGIAQFMPATAASVGVNPNDPYASLTAAANLMGQYVQQFGNYTDALVAYNAGPGAVGHALPAETQAYIANILGGQNGPGGVIGGNPQAGGDRTTFTTAEVQSICGPIAAAYVAAAIGQTVNLRDLVTTAEQRGQYNTAVGTYGNAGEQGILADLGINSAVVNQAQAQQAAASGIPTIINTQGHFYEASGYNDQTGQFNVGSTGQAVGGQALMTLQQMQEKTGSILGFIIPQLEKGSAAIQQFAQSAGNGFGMVDQAAQTLANQFGISLDQAKEIIVDEGATAKQVLGSDMPGSVGASDQAVEQFADKFKISWDQARAILESSGQTSDLVMGKSIPQDFQQVISAARGLETQFGISFGQAEAIIEDNGKTAKDVLGTGIPGQFSYTDDAAKKFADTFHLSFDQAHDLLTAGGVTSQLVMGTSGIIPQAASQTVNALTGGSGVYQAAQTAKTGFDAVGTAGSALRSPLIDAKGVIGSLGSTMGDVATNQATQISFVLQQLADKMPGLIQNVKDFISALKDIPTDINVSVNYHQSGSPGGGGGGGGGGSSGGGGGESSSGSDSGGDSGPVDMARAETDQSYRADLRNQGYAVGRDDNGQLYVEKRAGGGDVRAGQPYLIGENGPELFVPGMSGTVVSNAALPSAVGGASIDYNRLAHAIVSALGTQAINVQVDGQTLWRALKPSMARDARRNVTALAGLT